MILPAFDSHEYVKQLTAKGVNLPTAGALAEIRTELRILERSIEDLRKDMELSFARLDAQFAGFKTEMVRWLFAFFVVQTGTILTLKFL